MSDEFSPPDFTAEDFVEAGVTEEDLENQLYASEMPDFTDDDDSLYDKIRHSEREQAAELDADVEYNVKSKQNINHLLRRQQIGNAPIHEPEEEPGFFQKWGLSRIDTKEGLKGYLQDGVIPDGAEPVIIDQYDDEPIIAYKTQDGQIHRVHNDELNWRDLGTATGEIATLENAGAVVGELAAPTVPGSGIMFRSLIKGGVSGLGASIGTLADDGLDTILLGEKMSTRRRAAKAGLSAGVNFGFGAGGEFLQQIFRASKESDVAFQQGIDDAAENIGMKPLGGSNFTQHPVIRKFYDIYSQVSPKGRKARESERIQLKEAFDDLTKELGERGQVALTPDGEIDMVEVARKLQLNSLNHIADSYALDVKKKFLRAVRAWGGSGRSVSKTEGGAAILKGVEDYSVLAREQNQRNYDAAFGLPPEEYGKIDLTKVQQLIDEELKPIPVVKKEDNVGNVDGLVLDQKGKPIEDPGVGTLGEVDKPVNSDLVKLSELINSLHANQSQYKKNVNVNGMDVPKMFDTDPAQAAKTLKELRTMFWDLTAESRKNGTPTNSDRIAKAIYHELGEALYNPIGGSEAWQKAITKAGADYKEYQEFMDILSMNQVGNQPGGGELVYNNIKNTASERLLSLLTNSDVMPKSALKEFKEAMFSDFMHNPDQIDTVLPRLRQANSKLITNREAKLLKSWGYMRERGVDKIIAREIKSAESAHTMAKNMLDLKDPKEIMKVAAASGVPKDALRIAVIKDVLEKVSTTGTDGVIKFSKTEFNKHIRKMAKTGAWDLLDKNQKAFLSDAKKVALSIREIHSSLAADQMAASIGNPIGNFSGAVSAYANIQTTSAIAWLLDKRIVMKYLQGIEKGQSTVSPLQVTVQVFANAMRDSELEEGLNDEEAIKQTTR